MIHCVQFSTGAGSAEVAFRVEQIASADDRLVLLTADTMVEDEDNWRFANDVVQALSPRWEWIVIRDGRTPMQVGRDKRVVPNNRLAICSRVLKREALDRWIKHNCDPESSIIYLGFDWTEPHRFEKAEPLWKPYKISAPLMDAPYIEKSALMGKLKSMGITPPVCMLQGLAMQTVAVRVSVQVKRLGSCCLTGTGRGILIGRTRNKQPVIIWAKMLPL
jgi:hypothetical protein